MGPEDRKGTPVPGPLTFGALFLPRLGRDPFLYPWPVQGGFFQPYEFKSETPMTTAKTK